MRCLPILYCARSFKTNIIVTDAFTLRCTHVSQPMFLGNILSVRTAPTAKVARYPRAARGAIWKKLYSGPHGLTPNANRVFHKSKFSLFGKHNKVATDYGCS